MIQQLYHNPDIYQIHVDLPDNPLKYLNSYVVKGPTRHLVIDTGFNRPECQAALDDYDRVLARDPGFACCYYNKGNVYFRLKAWPEALEAYTQAIRQDPELAEAYFNRGLLFIYAGQKAQANADLSKAGELGIITAYNVIKRYCRQTD